MGSYLLFFLSVKRPFFMSVFSQSISKWRTKLEQNRVPFQIQSKDIQIWPQTMVMPFNKMNSMNTDKCLPTNIWYSLWYNPTLLSLTIIKLLHTGNYVIQVNLLMTSKITKWSQGHLLKSQNNKEILGMQVKAGGCSWLARYDIICLIFT